MTWPVLLALLPAILNFGILVYVLLRLPPSRPATAFAGFVFALTVWQTGDAVVRTCDTVAEVEDWSSILNIGSTLIAPIGIHFTLLFTGRQAAAQRPLVIFLLYAPVLLFEAFDTIAMGHRRYMWSDVWGWQQSPPLHAREALLGPWIAGLAVLMIVLLVSHAAQPGLERRRRIQAILIAGGFAFPTVQGSITQIVFPQLLEIPPLPIASTVMTTFSVATIVALARYGLFVLPSPIEASLVLDAMADAVVVADPGGRVLQANRAARTVAAPAPTDAAPATLASLLGLDPPAMEDFRARVLLPIAQDRDVDGVLVERARGDGGTLSLLVSARPLRIFGPRRTGALLVLRDISEARSSERALLRTADELARSNRDLQQFAYVASHDLQEPLRMVTNYVQLLSQRYAGKLDRDADEYIGFAVSGTKRMRDLIEALLQYARAGSEARESAPLDLSSALAEAVSNLSASLRECGAQVTWADLPAVRAPAGEVQRLFQNLIANAVKFRSAAPPRIRISAGREGDFWRIAVEDNGIGIAPQYHERIFGLFQRLHGREVPGTGMGLAICQKIVEHLGGRIWLRSEAGEGATFHFTLPA